MIKNSISFYDTKKYKIELSFSTSIFFYLFIVFFLPFGVSNYNPNHQYTIDFLLMIFFFFLPLLVFSLFNDIVLRPFFFKKASFKKIILWSIWTLVFLGTVLFFTYNILGNWHDFKLSSYIEFLSQVSVVLLFPIVGTFFFFRFQFLQNHIEHILTTKERSLDQNQLIHFKGQGSKDQITLSLTNFIYGKSQDNYVELYFLEKEQLKKILIRSSLSNLSESIDDTIIARCHRSYIVNLFHVISVMGGNNEITLTLSPFDSTIPVSKSYRDTILKNLHAIKNFV
tara:strand:- start:10189 stop:11037 length:849 start_codon:yes stop_codon:yes gene_type:complete